jgi:hypothetical protein
MEDDPNASQRVKAFGQPDAPFVVGIKRGGPEWCERR